MDDFDLTTFFIFIFFISFIFYLGYIIGSNKDKIFPKQDESTISELNEKLEQALEIEDYEKAIEITKKLEKKQKNERTNYRS